MLLMQTKDAIVLNDALGTDRLTYNPIAKHRLSYKLDGRSALLCLNHTFGPKINTSCQESYDLGSDAKTINMPVIKSPRVFPKTLTLACTLSYHLRMCALAA